MGTIESNCANCNYKPKFCQVYAVGSYGKDLGVYLEPEPHTLCYLDGQKGGITHLQFSADGTKLCAGGRKDNEILGKYSQMLLLFMCYPYSFTYLWMNFCSLGP